MSDLAIWEVDLLVDGPISVRQRLLTRQQKGFRVDDPFFSEIEIRSSPFGVQATIPARANDEESAHKAAVLFFGRMLDVLTLIINQPMNLSLSEGHNVSHEKHEVRRLVESHVIEEAFAGAHDMAAKRPSFLRALGWYRKALRGEDPFDKFLAFWNAIETVAGKYYRDIPVINKERAKNSCKSQIREAFKALWGSPNQWPNIPNETQWIDENHRTRIDIAHGVATVDVHTVVEVVTKLKIIEQVAYSFLRDWRDNFLYLNPQPETFSMEPIIEEQLVQMSC